jgi:predicted DNA-binding transcriptional regulator AlpA
MEHKPIDFDKLSDDAYVREADLVRSRRRSGAAPVLPFSSPTLWRLVARRAFPQPHRLAGRITAWNVGEVRAWLRDTRSSDPRRCKARGR